VSARAWRLRRSPLRLNRAADWKPWHVGATAAAVLEALCCPYWRHAVLGAPADSCSSGCWEPRCLDSDPRGLSRRERRRLRRTAAGRRLDRAVGRG